MTYSLLIGTPLIKTLPKKLSVLLRCDNNTYRVGDTLTIAALDDSLYKNDSQNLSYIMKHKNIKGVDQVRIVGDEYPAIVGTIIKN